MMKQPARITVLKVHLVACKSQLASLLVDKALTLKVQSKPVAYDILLFFFTFDTF